MKRIILAALVGVHGVVPMKVFYFMKMLQQYSQSFTLSSLEFSLSQTELFLGLAKSGKRFHSDVIQLERQSGFTKTLVQDTQS